VTNRLLNDTIQEEDSVNIWSTNNPSDFLIMKFLLGIKYNPDRMKIKLNSSSITCPRCNLPWTQ